MNYPILTFIALVFILCKHAPAQDLDQFDQLFRQGNYKGAAAEIETRISAKAGAVPSIYYYKQAEVYYVLFTSSSKTNQEHIMKAQEAALNYVKSPDFSTSGAEMKQFAGTIARECYKSGAEAFNNSNFVNAQECFTRAAEIFEILKDFNDIQKLWYYLAVSCQYNKDSENALKYFKILADHNYRDQNVYLNLSDLYKAKGTYPEALAILKKLIDFYPENKNYYELIQVLYEMNEKEQALEYIRNFNASGRYDTDVSMLEGTMYYEKAQNDSALFAFKRIVKNEPDNANASFNAGIILYNSALKHMKTAEQKYYDNPEKYNREKDQYLIKIKEAAVLLENAYKYDKENKNLMLALSDIYKRLQRDNEYQSLQNALKKIE